MPPCPEGQAVEIPQQFAIIWGSSSPDFRHSRSSPASGLAARQRLLWATPRAMLVLLSVQAGPTYLYMSIRDTPENCHPQGKPPGPPESPAWVVTAGHGVSLLPQVLEPITPRPCYSTKQMRTQTHCPFKKEKNYLVSSLSLSLL